MDARGGEATRRRGRGGHVVVTEEDVRGVFHMPITEAAKRLGVCVTVLKVRCRELGIARWPFRKMRKLDNMISILETQKSRTVAAASEDEKASKLETIKKTRELVLAQPNSNAHAKLGKINSKLRRKVLESSSARENSAEVSGKSGEYGSVGSGSQRSARTNDERLTNKKRSRGEMEQTSAPTRDDHGSLDQLLSAASVVVQNDVHRESSASPAESTFTLAAPIIRDSTVQPFLGDLLKRTPVRRELPSNVSRPTPRRFDMNANLLLAAVGGTAL